jgi:hypothetical protein
MEEGAVFLPFAPPALFLPPPPPELTAHTISSASSATMDSRTALRRQ